MGTPSEDYALLLDTARGVDMSLAKQVLADAGIPCLEHGPDFDVAELGVAAHQALRGANLYVPRGTLERARELLENAWGGIPERIDPEVEGE